MSALFCFCFTLSYPLVGYGKGLYPKNHIPTIPRHPHCRCHLVPVFTWQVNTKRKPNDNKVKEYINSLPIKNKQQLFGAKGFTKYKQGGSWQSLLRGWDGFENPQSNLKKVLDFEDKSLIINTGAQNDSILYRNKGFTHRYKRNGNAVIDQATYNKFTKKVIEHGGVVIRGDAKWQKRLDEKQATAMTIGDVLVFSKDATVSDVLEECYHFEQARKKLNFEYPAQVMTILNEIDAKQYLLKQADKYHIPEDECTLTKQQLEEYKVALEKLRKQGDYNG